MLNLSPSFRHESPQFGAVKLVKRNSVNDPKERQRFALILTDEDLQHKDAQRLNALINTSGSTSIPFWIDTYNQPNESQRAYLRFPKALNTIHGDQVFVSQFDTTPLNSLVRLLKKAQPKQKSQAVFKQCVEGLKAYAASAIRSNEGMLEALNTEIQEAKSIAPLNLESVKEMQGQIRVYQKSNGYVATAQKQLERLSP
jgi:hypothetical protein